MIDEFMATHKHIIASLFDEQFYLANNADVSSQGFNAFDHYMQYGIIELRDPNPLFSNKWYSENNGPLDKWQGVPLFHYIECGSTLECGTSELFCPTTYAFEIAKLRTDGNTMLGRFLATEFDSNWYLDANPDVRTSEHAPIVHYLKYGILEGRAPLGPSRLSPSEILRSPLFDQDWYRKEYHLPHGSDCVQHYITEGDRLGHTTHPLFDRTFYVSNLSTAIPASFTVLEHFLQIGGPAHADCQPLFDTQFYLQTNPDVASIQVIPIVHYLTYGWRENRDPSAAFSIRQYRLSGGDANCEPLEHYLSVGAFAGFAPAAYFDHKRVTEVFCDVQVTTALKLHMLLLGKDFYQRARLRESAVLPEPGIVLSSPATDVLRDGQPTLNALASLADQLPSLEYVKSYGSGKLFYKSAGQNLSDELKAAISQVPHDVSALEVIRALGAVTSRIILPQRNDEFSIPLLNSYRNLQCELQSSFNLCHRAAGRTRHGPVISVLMPVYRTPLVFLERAILSVIMQTYSNWQLVIVDDSSNDPAIQSLLEGYANKHDRITFVTTHSNGGISAASNLGLKSCTGEYIALLDHDDMLTVDALEVVSHEIVKDPTIDLLYSDECKLDVNDIPNSVMPKPDWSPLLLTSFMYTAHLSVYRASLIARVHGFRSRFDFSQDYDLALRIAEQTDNVIHIPRCLYGWRAIEGSAAQGDKPYARSSNVAALQSALERRNIDGIATALPACNRFSGHVQQTAPSISIIVPSDNTKLILQTIMSIVAGTNYQDMEIVVVTNSLAAEECQRSLAGKFVRFAIYDSPYNFSDKCNVGAAASLGSHLIFYNDDVRVLQPDWIIALLEILTLPNVGVVGPKLIYEDGKIQHAGMITGCRRLVGTAFHAYPESTSAHFNMAQSVREVSLICGACLAMPKSVFLSIGGFDAQNAPIAHSDVDLCLRAREAGYKCVYTPHSTLLHIGHLSIGEVERAERPFRPDKADIFLMRRFGEYLEDDPYFPRRMRSIVYLDSQEHFQYFKGQRVYTIGGQDVLLVSHDLSGSGAPKVIFDVAKILIRDGNYVTVVSPEDGRFRSELTKIGADVIVDSRFLSMDDAAIEFGRNFDVVICNTIVTWRAACEFAKFTKTFWYIHETQLIDHFYHNVEGFSQADYTKVVLWCGSVRSLNFLERIGLRAVVFPYGTDDLTTSLPSGCEMPGISPTRKRIAILATIEPRKGQDLAVLAFMQLPTFLQQGCELVVAGRTNDPEFGKAIRELAEKNPHVSFKGELDYDSYLELLRSADIVVCPSRDDTLPLVSLDALSLGKPLICSREVGTSDFIENLVSGIVLDENSPSCLSQMMMRVLEMTTSERDALGRRAREVFTNQFSMQRFERSLLLKLSTDQNVDAALLQGL